MRLRIQLAATVAAIATLAAAGAQAGTLFSYAGPTGELPTDSFVSETFTGAAGAAQLSFALDGFASLDGQNFYEDDFTLSLNGNPILTGTYNLGGGGNDVTFTSPVGASINNISGNGTDVTWNGGQVLISTPLSLAAGLNTLTFRYDSLTDGHAGFQGTGDEGWGLENISVTQGAVPEPISWALMIMGVASMGAVLRRQRRLQPVPVRI